MKLEPLTPGLYICRFRQPMKIDSVSHVLKILNGEGESFGVRFIPELSDFYQISNQVKEENK